MAEYIRRDGEQANTEAQSLINQGYTVSLVAYDPTRDAYVFDAETQNPGHHMEAC